MTNLVRWNPGRAETGLSRSMNDMLRDLFRDFPLSDGSDFNGRAWAPAVDVEETADAYLVTADVPGLTKKDLSISLEDNVLTISGDRKAEKEDERKESYRLERVHGTFSRSFSLPQAADPEKVQAAYKDGVLTVTIPKREESKSRRIDVKVD